LLASQAHALVSNWRGLRLQRLRQLLVERLMLLVTRHLHGLLLHGLLLMLLLLLRSDSQSPLEGRFAPKGLSHAAHSALHLLQRTDRAGLELLLQQAELLQHQAGVIHDSADKAQVQGILSRDQVERIGEGIVSHGSEAGRGGANHHVTRHQQCSPEASNTAIAKANDWNSYLKHVVLQQEGVDRFVR